MKLKCFLIVCGIALFSAMSFCNISGWGTKPLTEREMEKVFGGQIYDYSIPVPAGTGCPTPADTCTEEEGSCEGKQIQGSCERAAATCGCFCLPYQCNRTIHGCLKVEYYEYDCIYFGGQVGCLGDPDTKTGKDCPGDYSLAKYYDGLG